MKLYPKIKPYRHGFLKVGDGHEIYFELVGNPKGKPVLFVHGGPGGGCSPSDRRFFNPKKFNVLLFDQRGSGRSTPFASTKNNTTQKLVSDMRKLLKFLNMEKVFLFGGSWGSTLSLAYAVKHPKTVTGMMLRGIFLGTKEEINYTFGGGAEYYYPDAWERFVSMVPKSKRKNMLAYYLKKMQNGSRKSRRKHSYEWAYYELSMIRLKSKREDIVKNLKKYNFESLSVLEAHYMISNCFMADNYLLRNARNLKMPVTIIQGRYDIITPPIAAWNLNKTLKKSKLIFTTSGHGSSDRENTETIIKELKKI